MKKKLSIGLAAIFSFACLPLSMPASAETAGIDDRLYEILSDIWDHNEGIELFLDDDGNVVFNDNDDALYTEGKHLLVEDHRCYFYYVDDNGDKIHTNGKDYWKYVQNESSGIFYSVNDDGEIILDDDGNISYFIEMPFGEKTEAKYEGDGIFSFIGLDGNLWYTDGKYCYDKKEYLDDVELMEKFEELCMAISNGEIPREEGLAIAEAAINREISVEELASIIRGDATQDEEVSIADVVLINRVVLGKDSVQGAAEYAADVNNDGCIDANDALSVMQFVVGLVDEL
ncbi:MAG: dockerin type I repeat-containing protein [Oscillospiraceae bacterium]|nr:dockerin type I repeat-containing protein [Oscillospiraceae bacterium]